MKYAIIILFILFKLSSEIQAQVCQTDSLMFIVHTLEKKGNYDSSLSLLSPYLVEFDENWFAISKEVIYLNEKKGHYHDNVCIFNKGHELGYFYLIHPALPKFKPYKEFVNFETLANTDIKLRAEAINKSMTIYEVDLPECFSQEVKYPLCMILHGGGSNLEKVKKHWQSSILDSYYIKVYLQSYRYYDSKTYGWRSGDKRADADILRIYNEIKEKYRIDTTNVIVCGISAGGTYAIDLSIRKIIPVSGFITFCPGIPAGMTSDFLLNNQNPTLKGFIVGGEKDYYLPKQQQMTAIFDSINFRYKYLVLANLGHQYPDNEGNLVDRAIQFFKSEK